MKDINLSPKAKNRLNKFVRGITFFTAIILFIAAFFLFALVLDSKHPSSLFSWVIVSAGIIFIIIFGVMCLFLATQFKRELLFDDNERLKNWDKLSKGYKKFFIFQEIFTLFFSLFLILFALYLAFILKDWFALILFMSGSSLLISLRKQYLQIRDKNEGKIIKRIMLKLSSSGLILLAIVLVILIYLNFGKFLMQ
jgi:hypothetical protein